MVLGDQIAEAKVVDVIWTPSKDGFLKPRVQIEPVVIGGVEISYATGFNAKFIEDNKIGVGALIKLVRSGDVIPHIMSVVQPAVQAQMPTVPYEWNETHVDVLLKNIDDNEVVREKRILQFFKTIGVVGVGKGHVKKMIAAGYNTVPKILSLSVATLKEIEGFQQKTAENIAQGIKDRLAIVQLPIIMHASNIFSPPGEEDKGAKSSLGTRKFAAILKKWPSILVSTESPEEKIAMVNQVSGMGIKTATKFVKRIPSFVKWMIESKLESRLEFESKETTTEKDTSHVLYGKKVVLTGFRPADIIAKLEAVGAEIQTAPSSKTFLVVAKDPKAMTGKVAKALTMGVSPERIVSKEQLLEEFFS
tara:strand:- start:345 stop:1430 length:1086 start_codon:yes stop_codon:yes gene_type:complete